MKTIQCILALYFTCLIIQTAHAELMFTAPKLIGYESDELTKSHQRLSRRFSKILAEDIDGIEYKPLDSWQDFSKHLLGEQIDIVIMAPHLAAYVMPHENAVDLNLISRFPGKRIYHVAIEESSKIKTLKEAIVKNQAICVPPSSHMSRILIMRIFNDNLILQPRLIEVSGSTNKLLATQFKKRCKGIVIDDETLNRYNTNNANSKIRSIYSTQAIPNDIILVSTRLTPTARSKIKTYLQSIEFASEFPELFNFYSPNESKQMIPITKSEIKEMNILPGVIWGW